MCSLKQLIEFADSFSGSGWLCSRELNSKSLLPPITAALLISMATGYGMDMIETLTRRMHGFHFPLPFPFADAEILEEYLLYLEGILPSLHHVTLTEAERSILDAWQESCQNLLEEEMIENQT